MNKSTLLANKKIFIPATLFLAISIFVIILSIISFVNRPNNADIGKPISYIDEITGEKVETTSGVSSGSPVDKNTPAVMGTKQLLDKGIPKSTLKDLNFAITEYMDKSNLEKTKISYYKDSYKRISKTPMAYSIKIALNNAQKILYGKIIYKGIDNYEISLHDDEAMKNQVHSFSYCSPISCPKNLD